MKMAWTHTSDTDAGALECVPLTPERFADMEDLFRERQVTRNCFCMHWRRPDGGFDDRRDNRDRFADIATEGPPPGLIGYIENRPAGWVQVGPRSDFPTLMRSRLFKPVDEVQAWSINCFVVRPNDRRKGVGRGLLAAAIAYAKSQRAKMIEAYPVDGSRQSVVDYFTGTMGMFSEYGFVEMIRRNDTRPIVRLTL
jgi:GNAT superfamily N-acetyltransferase